MDKTPTPAAADSNNELARFILEQLRERRLDRDQALRFLQQLKGGAPAAVVPVAADDDIAIIGIACRFPQAESKEQFWDNLLAGRNSIRPFPAARRADLAAIDANDTELFQGGFLDQVDAFDNEYFRIPPALARQIDPYQRVLMEILVETLEDAGYHRGSVYGKPIGVYAGNDHTHRYFNNYLDFIEQPDFNSVTGSWTAVLASRLSYLFNLKGPALVVDTACSSALVALDAAIKALRAGDCEAALVGAANLFFAPGKGIVGEIENSDFQVRAFDRRASGTVWGEGVAAVMIKPLAHALRDGDPIHAVIKAVGVNNDGASNGLTAPNAKAQQEILLKTWERARIDPSDIGYIETHGTGTHLGDPIEIKGLVGAFERSSRRKQFCGIGSVKTNIGHTVGVAGLASLIKVVLSLKNQQLPASINFSEPNPFIDFCNSPVYVNDRVRPWPRGEKARLAGVSSFSLSGTNAHVLVQEAPAPAPAAAGQALQLFTVSARNATLFARTVRRYLAHFPTADASLADASFTAAVGREHHPLRAAIVCDSIAQLLAALERLLMLAETGQACDDGSLFYQLADGGAGDRQARQQALDGMHQQQPDALRAVARLYVNGASFNWTLAYEGQARRRIHLPPQPFERQRFWDKAPGVLRAPPVAISQPAAAPAPSRELLMARVASEPARVLGLDAATEPLPYQVVGFVWTEVLGYRHVALREDFFALGGDSLSGMKIVQLLNELFGLDLNIADLLGQPTLHDFVARMLERHNFAAVLAGEALAAQADDAIEPAAPAPEHALSRMQQRMFLLDSLSPGLPVYNVNAVVRLPAAPDPGATERIVGQLIARHEILRTAFALRGDQLVQRVLDSVPFSVERSVLADAGEAAVQAAMAEFVRPFDIGRPPLLRVALFDDAAGASYLAIDMHHIVTDGASMGVLVAEFLALQSGAALAPLPFQYKDFAAWQNGLHARAAFAQHRQFWLERFAGTLPTLDLQTDYPRPAYQDFRGAKQHLLVDAALTAQLQQLARAHGSTLFMVLLAAFNSLLYRLGGGSDLVVGSPVAGRSRNDLQGLIGMFVNTLALRNQVEAGDSFASFLQRVKAGTLAALGHQDFPYEELVEQLALPRVGGRNPLFDVYFALQNEDMGLAQVPGIEMVPFDSGTAKFDMTVVARQSPQGLHIEWDYARSLYRADSIATMAQQFVRILRQAAAQPATPLDELDLLGEAGRHTLLVAYNATDSAYPSTTGLAQLFEAAAGANPDAVALELDGVECSYAQLNAAANQVAHRLAAAGATPGQFVGLLFERSFGMIEAMLGVLKAGCAYVALDPEHPPQRWCDMLADAGAAVLLTGPGLDASALPELCVIVPAAEDLAGLSRANPAPCANGDSLAYVAFTSGSTGRPKGTLIRQNSVSRVVLNTNYVSLSGADRILQLSNYAFDGSVFDIWAALLHGARLVLLRPRDVTDMEALARIVRERRVSVFFVTTALFNVLVDTSLDALAGVRHILFGGEGASVKHVARALAALGPGRLIHVYGPTETTVFATAHPIHVLDPRLAGVPIGTALANTSTYVLDAQLRPTPMGAAGELYIGGAGVALGYLGLEELTRERFLPDPFQPGQWMYRSGDLVKWLAEGALQFLGRRDHQVKIRGYRIELGEIEAAIARHPGVKECLVSAEADAHGARQLCAYVVPHGEAGALAQELRGFLAASLPGYMVPAAIACLAAFPLNANGKIDRSLLSGAQPVRAPLVAARDEPEALLARIWCDSLGLDEVGIDENFFALGGDSIKAIQIVARLRTHGYALQMPQLFKYQSIAELAPHMTRADASTAEQGAVTGALPLNPIQRWFFDAGQPQPEHFNHAMLIALEAAPSAADVGAALEAVCAHHDGLRARFRHGAAGWEGWLDDAARPAWRVLEFHDGPWRPGSAAGDARLLQVQAALALDGPLVAVGLFDGDHGAGLCFAVHHLVVDVVSWSVLLEDFQGCLRQVGQGEAPQLPAKTASVIAWGRALQDYADSDTPRAHLRHWTALAAAPVYAAGAPCGMLADAGVEMLRIDAGLSALAMGEANRAYTTEPQHLLLTALGQALGRDGDDCLVRLESHGRDALPGLPDAGRTVGWFTAAFPFLLRAGIDAGGALKACKESLRNVPGKGIDFGVLRYLAGGLAPDDQAALAAIAPQVGFNFLGKVDAAAVRALGRKLTTSGQARLELALDIVASFEDGQLVLEALYDSARLDGAAVRALLRQFEASLQALVAHCSAARAVEKTASDFTVTRLAQGELEDIFSDLELD
jgi:amino acid adenylation domain-containing protein/non-ribosomal peptide synthase protein (TIGR01720 family)